jgi:alpha-glucosidase (family GH31 glycosyl hydrolase)
MLSDLKEMGFKVVVSQDPVIAQANKKQWEEADRLGYFVKDSTNGKSYDMPWPWGGNCGVVDFTIPEVADWWEPISRNLLTMVSPASGQTWVNLPGVTRSRRNAW